MSKRSCYVYAKNLATNASLIESSKDYFELIPKTNQRIPFNGATFDSKKDYAKQVHKDLIRHAVYEITESHGALLKKLTPGEGQSRIKIPKRRSDGPATIPVSTYALKEEKERAKHDRARDAAIASTCTNDQNSKVLERHSNLIQTLKTQELKDESKKQAKRGKLNVLKPSNDKSTKRHNDPCET